MVYLAIQGQTEPARKQAIAEAEEISADYVEQILMKLKSAGLVCSHRGRNGGFSLACDPAATPIGAILHATEGSFALVPCLNDKPCDRASLCVTRALWNRATRALDEIFSKTTLADLAEEAKKLHASKSITFQI